MQTNPFIDRLYDETMALLVEMKLYVSAQDPRDRREAPSVAAALAISKESMRTVVFLTQTMAWVLAQKAVAKGEMTRSEVLGAKNALSGHSLAVEAEMTQTLPPALKGIRDRAYALWTRVARIEEQQRLQAGLPAPDAAAAQEIPVPAV